MVYFSRNSISKTIEKEPPRRDYYSQQSYCSFNDNHHAPMETQSARFAGRESGRPNFRWGDNYDYVSGNYDSYRRNYRSSAPNHRLAPKPLNHRRNWTVQSYKPYQSSSSRIRNSNYDTEKDQKEMKYPIPTRRYYQKQTFPPRNYVKLSDNRESGNYHGRKMHHQRVKTYHKYHIGKRVTTSTAEKQHSAVLPPLPPLPKSEIMMTNQDGFPAFSSPSYSEEGERLRSCSPVLEYSPAPPILNHSPDNSYMEL